MIAGQDGRGLRQRDAVLVTGVSTGLGLEAAVFLAERGFHVYAGLRDQSRRAALDEAAAQRKVELDIIELDITDQGEIDNAVATIVAQAGGIYGLVNNAGIGLRGYFEDLADHEIRAVFETNLFGTMAVTRAVLPIMRRAGRGRIVVVTSIGGRIASLAVSAYCASKFAQEGFAEALYQELLPLGIGVSIVEPAIIKTERWGANRGIAHLAEQPSSPYYAWFRNSERLANRLVETTPTKPVDVARAIHHALAAERPRLRYMVGWRAGLALLLRRYLPEPLFERLYFGTAISRVTTVGR